MKMNPLRMSAGENINALQITGSAEVETKNIAFGLGPVLVAQDGGVYSCLL